MSHTTLILEHRLKEKEISIQFLCWGTKIKLLAWQGIYDDISLPIHIETDNLMLILCIPGGLLFISNINVHRHIDTQ
jgi:hypothetical protein